MNDAKMARDIADVRKTAEINMAGRLAVIKILKHPDHKDTAVYLQENKKEYMGLLELSAKY